MIMKVWFLVFTLFSFGAFGISEQKFQESYQLFVLPEFKTYHQSHFINSDGMKINYYSKVSEKAKKTLVILPGRTEPAKKYAELLYDLKNDEVNFFVMDHQGQGESDHLLSDTQKGHVEKFENYIEDFTYFMEEVVLKNTKDTEHLFLAHSMGSLVGIGFMQKNPQIFSKAVLNSPMLGINTFPLSNGIMKRLTSRQISKGIKHSYATFTKPYNPYFPFWLNPNTSSYMRFEKSKELFLADPSIIVGGPTVKWLDESLRASREIRNSDEFIPTSILILKGGRDIVVKTKLHNDFCFNQQDCRIYRYPKARHEVLFEQDGIRDMAINSVKNFLDI